MFSLLKLCICLHWVGLDACFAILKVMNVRYNDLFKLLLDDGALMMGSREFKVIVHRFQIIIATQETHTTLTQAPQENLMTEEYLDFNSSLGSKMPTGY